MDEKKSGSSIEGEDVYSGKEKKLVLVSLSDSCSELEAIDCFYKY